MGLTPLSIETQHSSLSTAQQDQSSSPPYNDHPIVFQDIVLDWTASLTVGALVVSYWRGTWTLIDIWDCKQSPEASLTRGDTFCLDDGVLSQGRLMSAWKSYGVGLVLLILGTLLLWSGAWEYPCRKDNDNPGHWLKRKTLLRTIIGRFLSIYILGAAAVCVWRGLWYLLDYWVFPEGNPVMSLWITTVVGALGAYTLFAGASLLAPPALFILDGPSDCDGPPVALTLLTCFYDITLPANKAPPTLPKYVYFLDCLTSFILLPIFVLGFWHGCWGLMDQWLWGFTDNSQDLNRSLGYSTAIAVSCLVLASDDLQFVRLLLIPSKVQSKVFLRSLTRLTSLVLAFGTVNFWRVVWYVWDIFFTTTQVSAWISHIIGVVGLLLLGAFSSICAPPATMGVDVLAHPDCSDEPLFSNIPVPWETLFLGAIGRSPLKQPPQEAVHDGEEEVAEEIAVSADGDEEKELFRKEQISSIYEMDNTSYYERQRRTERPTRQMYPREQIIRKTRTMKKRDSCMYRNR